MDHDHAGVNDAGEHQHVYAQLTPDTILLALESVGFLPEAALHSLNSFENRVYSFRDDDGSKYVVKFYRPGRWHRDQIQEEHAFLFELADTDIPVIAPVQRDRVSVFEASGFLFAVFPQRGGRPFEAGNDTQLEVMGRTVGRLHAVAQQRAFSSRERLDVEQFARPALAETLQSPLLPPHLRSAYQGAAESVLEACSAQLQRLHDVNWQRCHGDLHPGNILWTGDGVLLIDFD
ncbi:MAG TPA: serine/threonine protein kinase, partial [Permianibacter sp.]|nr:serine/threonine protein kinase [Permianibacter sp.]